MSRIPPTGAAAGSRRFWAVVFTFAILNAATWVGYHQYAASRLRLLHVTQFEPSSYSPVSPRATLRWAFNLDVAKTDRAPGAISPNVAGKWFWPDARTLTFTPDADWPRATRFNVTLAGDHVRTAEGIRLDRAFAASFNTEPLRLLTARQGGFDESNQLVVELEFNDSVLPADVLARLKLIDERHQAIPCHLFGQAPGKIVRFQTSPLDQRLWSANGAVLNVELSEGLAGASGPMGLPSTVSRQINVASDLRAIEASAIPPGPGDVDVLLRFNNQADPAMARLVLTTEPPVAFKVLPRGQSALALSGPFEPGKRYLVKIGATPAGADRKKFPRAESFSVFIPDRRMEVWFEHADGYLGSQGNRTLLAHTLNVSEVTVTVTRLYDNNVVAWRNASPSESWSDTTELATPIARRKISLPAAKNQTQDLRLSLDDLLPPDAPRDGVYRVALSTGNTTDRYRRRYDEDEEGYEATSTIVTMSDVALHARQSRDALDVWAVSLSTAEPIGDVVVRAYSNKNQLLGEGRTDGSGLLRMPALHPGRGEHIAVLTAQHELPTRLAGEAEKASHVEAARGLTWLDLDGGEVNLSELDTSGKPFLRNGFEAFIFTERGVYRPGETAHLRAIVRGPDLSLPKSFPVRWQLRRPDLRDWQSQVVTLAADGTSSLDIALPDDLPTGRWTAELQLPGESTKPTVFGSATFNVEEFVPNRMKVKLDVGHNTERVSMVDGPLTAEIHADYLFGQPVTDRPATLTTRVEQATFAPKEWQGWTFGDAASTSEVFNGKQAVGGRAEQEAMTLDQQGHAKWELDADTLLNPSDDDAPKQKRSKHKAAPLPKAHDYPGPWRATFYAAVIETGGRAVSASRSVEVDRLPYYLGVRPRQANVTPGSPAQFELAAVTPAGKNDAVASAVEVKLYRERWNTSLVQEKGSYHYVSTRQLEAVGNAQSINLVAGRAAFQVTPSDGGSFVLTAKDANGFITSIGFYANAGAWEENVSRDDPEKVDLVLSLPPRTAWEETRDAVAHPSVAGALNLWHHGTPSAPRTVAFRSGDTAQVLVRSPFAGRLLLTVETDTVLSKQVIDMPASHLTTSVELPRGCASGAFITATVIRAIDPNASWRSHRAFGVTRVPMDNSELKLNVQIVSPTDTRPAQSMPVAVRVVDANGHPAAGAAVTVAAVDEGILSLTNFATPNPFTFFTTPRSHGVKWSDIYGRLMPEVAKPGRSSETGGDAGLDDAPAGRHTTPVSARRVRPVALITAVLHTDSDGVAKTDFSLPDFSGQLRVMAVASTSGSFGSSQSTTLVRSPLLIQSSWPRFAAPGDTFTVPVVVFNRTPQAGKAQVAVELTSPMRFAAGNAKRVEVASDPIPAGGSTTVEFTVSADQIAGVAHARVVATLNGETTQEAIELPVRPASPEISTGGYAIATPGHPTTVPVGGEFVAGTARLQVRAGPMPSLELPRGLDYLERYPYGCAEQTTSECFPLLALSDIGPKIAPGLFEPVRIEERLQSGITKLIGMQCADGGLAMWPGQREDWPWASVYAAHMLVEAEAAKHKVPLEFRDSLLAYVRNLLNEATDRQDTIELQAYACYVLALAGRPERAVMDRLTEIITHPKSSGAPTAQARFQLAAAWLAAGRRDLADGLIPQTLPQPRTKRQLDGNVGSPIRDRAILLSTLLDVQPDRADLPEIAQRLADAGRDGYWQSTQDAAFAVMALGKYIRQSKPGSPFDEATLSLDGKVLAHATHGETLTLNPTGSGILSFDITGPADAKGHLSYLASGVPMKAPADQDAGLRIRRRYLTAAGNPIPNDTVRSGDLVSVEITIEASGPMENVVIDDLLPAGLEIENAHLATAADAEQVVDAKKAEANAFSHGRADARDDRLVVVGAITSQGKGTFTYLARVVTPGTFVVPPVRGECMYDVGVHSLSGGGHTLTVTSWGSKGMARAE